MPPLIIGDAPDLAAKLRLVRKAVRLVDVIASTGTQWRSEFATAQANGVPVNVLDNRQLSGFYFGAIVDRALLIIATGHVIANQIYYIGRCGFVHAAIKPADHLHWQQAYQAIRYHFQHIPDCTRSWCK